MGPLIPPATRRVTSDSASVDSHTAATIAVAAGESVRFVQAQLGHADVRTTQRYAYADHQAHRAARVAAFRNQAGTTAR
jgi:site-specific recombinase XerD